jgi:hypothetical protein
MGQRFSGKHPYFLNITEEFELILFAYRFEAYDEPWKTSFDTDTQKWESKWGLMDENRNVKDGLKIPDCGGTTVDKAY